MDWWLFSFFIGAILSLFLPIVPAIFHVLLVIILAIVVFNHSSTKKLTAFLLGSAWMLFNGALYQTIWKDNNIDVETD